MSKLIAGAAALLIACVLLEGAAARAQIGLLPPPTPPTPYPPYWSPYSYYIPIPQPDINAPNPWAPKQPGPVTPPEGNKAQIKIVVPSTANDIWIDHQKMPSRLADTRYFLSPELQPGHRYSYEVKASWVDRGRIVTRERRAVLHPNQVTVVDFSYPPGKAPATFTEETP